MFGLTARLGPMREIRTRPGQLTFAQVRDGLCNTLAVGEKRFEEYRDAYGQLIDNVTPGHSDGPHYRLGWHSSRNTTSPVRFVSGTINCDVYQTFAARDFGNVFDFELTSDSD